MTVIQKMKVLRKLFKVFIATVVVLILVAVFWPELYMIPFWKINFPESKYPLVYMVAKQRGLSGAEATKNHPQVTFADLNFHVPWAEKPLEQKLGEDAIALTYPDTSPKRGVYISHVTNFDVVEVFKKNIDQETLEKVKTHYGENMFESNYTLLKTILNIDPRNITIFSPKTRMVDYPLSLVKILVLPSSVSPEETVAYGFSTKHIKGFQFGDANRNEMVSVIFFDEEDNRYDLVVWGSQNEIDFILNSIRVGY